MKIKLGRDFKGVWIPKHIWLSTDLTLQEKIFLAEIDSLDVKENKYSGCYASNEYFSEFFKVSKTRVSLVIKSLTKKGYITSKLIYDHESKNVTVRILKVVKRH